MRKFGKDSPEFFVFQLEGSKETYKIPLAASMSSKDLIPLKKSETSPDGLEMEIEVLKKYVGDAIEDLPPKGIGEIMTAWAEESRAQGASVGES